MTYQELIKAMINLDPCVDPAGWKTSVAIPETFIPVCFAASGVLLIVFILRFAKKAIFEGELSVKNHIPNFLITIIIALSVCNPFVYSGISTFIHDMYIEFSLISPLEYEDVSKFDGQSNFNIDPNGNLAVQGVKGQMIFAYHFLEQQAKNEGRESIGSFIYRKVFGLPIIQVVAVVVFYLFIAGIYSLINCYHIIVLVLIYTLPPVMVLSFYFDELRGKIFKAILGTIFLPFCITIILTSIYMSKSITQCVDLMALELTGVQNSLFLIILGLFYNAFMAYSLPVIARLFDLPMLKYLRAVFPITWVEIAIKKTIFIIQKITTKGV